MLVKLKDLLFRNEKKNEKKENSTLTMKHENKSFQKLLFVPVSARNEFKSPLNALTLSY